MQRWVIKFEPVSGQLPSKVRWAQHLPLGLNAVGEYRETHRAPGMKPHTVRSVVVDHTRLSMTAVVCWLPDAYSPEKNPTTLQGQELDIMGCQVRCVDVTCVADVAQRDLMGEDFADPWLPDPFGSVTDPVVEFRVRSLSPWVYSENDPATQFHPGRMVSRMARRWNDLLVWQPNRQRGSDLALLPESVPREVIDELTECTTVVNISRLTVSEQQVAYDESRQKARLRQGVEVDAVVRCVPDQVETLLWFQTVMRFAVWSGIATHTTSGLGQVDVQQVRRLSDLPQAHVPEWQMW